MVIVGSLVFLWLLGFGLYFCFTGLVKIIHGTGSINLSTTQKPLRWLGLLTIILATCLEFGSVPLVVHYLTLTAFGLLLPCLANIPHSQLETDTVQISVKSLGLFLIFIVIAGLFLRWYKLGAHGLIVDEAWQFKTAAGYLKTGKFKYWDFFRRTTGRTYHRAWPFTWLLTQALKLGGVNLYSARLVAFLWGGLLFVPVYYLTEEINLNATEKIITFGGLATSPHLITTARWIRFYSMFYVTFLAAALFLLKTYKSTRLKRTTGYGIFSVLCLALSWSLHSQATALLILSVGIFYLLEWFQNGQPVQPGQLAVGAILVGCGLGGGLLALTSESLVDSFLLVLQPPRLTNGIYLHFLTDNLLGKTIGGLGVALAVHRGWTYLEDRFFLLVLLVPLPLTFALFKPVPQSRYVIYLIPILCPLLVKSFYRWLRKNFRKNKFMFFVAGLCLLVVLPTAHLAQNLEYIWGGHPGFLAWPREKASNYKNAVNYLARQVPEDNLILLLNFPSYHAAQLREQHPRVKFRSMFAEKISLLRLRKLHQKYPELVVVSSYTPLDPLSDGVKSYLQEKFNKKQLPGSHEIVLYTPAESANYDKMG